MNSLCAQKDFQTYAVYIVKSFTDSKNILYIA